jgi:hypothetical protein
MYSFMHSLTSALDGSEWSGSHLSYFTPREGDPATLWIGGWVGTRVGLDTVSKRKIPSPYWELNSDHPIVQPIASCYTDWAIPALVQILIVDDGEYYVNLGSHRPFPEFIPQLVQEPLYVMYIADCRIAYGHAGGQRGRICQLCSCLLTVKGSSNRSTIIFTCSPITGTWKSLWT